jgi:hypothetical protein
LLAALALTTMLLTACGGGGNERTKVEASLQDYLNTIPDPQACLGSRLCGQGAFPVGAGAPHVTQNSCKKIHTGGWSCVITFAPGKTALPVAVAVKGSNVYAAAPMSRQVLPPATVYEGGP